MSLLSFIGTGAREAAVQNEGPVTGSSCERSALSEPQRILFVSNPFEFTLFYTNTRLVRSRSKRRPLGYGDDELAITRALLGNGLGANRGNLFSNFVQRRNMKSSCDIYCFRSFAFLVVSGQFINKECETRVTSTDGTFAPHGTLLLSSPNVSPSPKKIKTTK